MLERNFMYVNNVYDNQPKPLNEEGFRSLLACQEVEQAYNTIQKHIQEVGEYQHSDPWLKKYKGGYQTMYAVTIAAQGYTNNTRSKATCVYSGVMAVDLDEMNVHQFEQTMLIKAEARGLTLDQFYHQEGILFVGESISGQGCTLYITRARGLSIPAMLQRVAERLGVQVDTSCIDGSRLKFIAPLSTVHFCDWDRLFHWESEEEQAYWTVFQEPTQQSNNSQTTVKQPSNNYQTTVKQPSNNYQTTIKQHNYEHEQHSNPSYRG